MPKNLKTSEAAVMALLCLWLARAAARMAQPRRPEFQLAHALYVHNDLVVKGTAGDALFAAVSFQVWAPRGNTSQF